VTDERREQLQDRMARAAQLRHDGVGVDAKVAGVAEARVQLDLRSDRRGV
jgi:hypothetical protein